MISPRLKSHSAAYDEEYYRAHYQRLAGLDFDCIPSFFQLKKWLNARVGEIIFDAGCGIGYLLEYACPPGALGLGADFSPVALRQAIRLYPRLAFFQGDLLQLGLKSGCVDKVLCFNVIEHVRESDKLIREIHRVLKAGGTLAIGTNMKYSLCNLIYKLLVRDHTHEKELTVSEFVRLVGKYFRVIETRKSSCVRRFPTAVNRIFHHLLRADILIKAVK